MPSDHPKARSAGPGPATDQVGQSGSGEDPRGYVASPEMALVILVEALALPLPLTSTQAAEKGLARIEQMLDGIAELRSSLTEMQRRASETIGEYQRLTQTDYPGTLRRRIRCGRVVIYDRCQHEQREELCP